MAPARRRRSTRSPAAAVAPATPVVVTRESDLPAEHANELLHSFKGKLHTVKTQELKLEDGTTILIARVKVPTPKGVSGHLIRRFDTDAVSASSLFRAAFPHAPWESERAEMSYLEKQYSTKLAGDEDESGSGKLTGTWVPTDDAVTLAKEYGLAKFASELIAYETPLSANNGTITSPAAPTPRKSKSPVPPTAPTSAGRSKRARVSSPPATTRSAASSMQSLQAAASTVVSPTTAAANNAAMTAAAATPSRSTRSKAAAPPAAVSEDVADADEDASGKGGIQIVQEVVQDETTGMTIEETKITLTGDEAKAVMGDSSEGLIGTEEQAREAAENALKLIESLKEQGTLQSSTSKRAREDDAAAAAAALEEDADEDEAENVDGDSKPGVFKRLFGRRQQKPLTKRRRQPRQTIGDLQVMQSPDGAQVLVAQTAAPPQPEANRRRYIAMAGMVVMGAATAAAPYFFG